MYYITPDCAKHGVLFYVNNLAEAEACRDAYVAAAAPNQEVCGLVQPTLTEVCSSHPINGNCGYQFWNCSPAQITNCEQDFCAIDCTWTESACP